MKFLSRIILWPLAVFSFASRQLADKLFDLGIWKSVEFELPVIYVGSMGNHQVLDITLYIHLLMLRQNIKSIFHLGRFEMNKLGFKTGQEEGLYYTTINNEDNSVKGGFTSRNKILALSECCQHMDGLQCAIYNDAFIIDELRPSFRVLVTSYNNLFYNDLWWPIGERKMDKRSAQMANVIVVSDCPASFERDEILTEITKYSKALVFFTYASIDNSNASIEFVKDRDNFDRSILEVVKSA